MEHLPTCEKFKIVFTQSGPVTNYHDGLRAKFNLASRITITHGNLP
jgi:hypothetical protein